MEEIIQSELQKLFPKFNSPITSRFSDFFKKISEKNKNETSKKYLIIPEKLINDKEKRTSIIIKGIPSAFGYQNFYDLLCHFNKDIRFFYIPSFGTNKWKFVYAFVNLENKNGVLDIFKGLTLIRDKFKSINGFDFSKLEIYFSKSQNINRLIKKYQKNYYQNHFLICN